MFSEYIQRLIRDGYYNAKLRKILIFNTIKYRSFIFYSAFVLRKIPNVWLNQHRSSLDIAIYQKDSFAYPSLIKRKITKQ
jgi:hypothetical protein